VKYAIIRRVPFKMPGKLSRIMWGHVLCEREGMALVLVPNPEADQPHSIFIAEENVGERIFESVGAYRFDVDTCSIRDIGEKLRMLGIDMEMDEAAKHFRPRKGWE
jgi:hypothetical protein